MAAKEELMRLCVDSMSCVSGLSSGVVSLCTV